MPTRLSGRRAITSRSRARSSNRPPRSTRSRTSSSVSAAAMSCRRRSSTREGRQRWLRDARRRLDQRRAEQARPIPRSRAKRLVEARRRLDEELAVERRANADYEAYRARGVMKDGRRFGGPPKPYQPPELPAGKIKSDRSRFAQRQDAARLGAGLQRPGRLHRRSDRDRGRGDDRLSETSGSSNRWSPRPRPSSPRPE